MKVPLYEYECPKDGLFEQIHKFSDPPLAACPTCGGPIEKLLSAPAIQFKGTGWYITDYARKSSGDGGKEGQEKGGAKESSKESGSSAASEAKSGASETKSSTSSSGEKSEKKK